MKRTVLKKVKEVYKDFEGARQNENEPTVDPELLKGLVRTNKDYFLPLFGKVQTLVEQLRKEDVFEPKLFESDKELFNLSLIVTVVLTNPTLRSTLRNGVEWETFTKVELFGE